MLLVSAKSLFFCSLALSLYQRLFRLLPGIQRLPIDLEHHSSLVQHHRVELINFLLIFTLHTEIFHPISSHFAFSNLAISFVFASQFLIIFPDMKFSFSQFFQLYAAKIYLNEFSEFSSAPRIILLITRCHQMYHFWVYFAFNFPFAALSRDDKFRRSLAGPIEACKFRQVILV